MRPTSKVAAVIATAALTAGTITVTSAGASSAEDTSAAKSTSTEFNFLASAYGSRVFNRNNDLVDSGRTAWAFVACTSKTGRTDKDHLAKVELPGKQLKIGPVTTESRSVKIKDGAKSVSTTKVGDIVLRGRGLASLKIEGLKGRSVSKYKNGEFSQSGGVDLLNIKAVLAGGIELNLPVNPDNINPGQEVKIPGLANLRFLDTKGKTKENIARNNSVALEIEVRTPGPLKGQTVRVGQARTELEKVSKEGMVRGYGQAARGELLNGLLDTGRIAHQPLPCVGTEGKWRRNSVAGINVGPIRIGALSGQTRGWSEPGRRPVAHTRARLANVKLTKDLQIGAVQSWAKVVRKGDKYKKRSGVKLLKVRAGGKNITKRLNRAINKGDSVTIPGIVKITPNVVERHKRSISVTALKIRLLDVAKPLSSTIHLANSKARIKK